jgi:hypothetical protein
MPEAEIEPLDRLWNLVTELLDDGIRIGEIRDTVRDAIDLVTELLDDGIRIGEIRDTVRDAIGEWRSRQAEDGA